MQQEKSETLTVRLTPEVKTVLRQTAAQERRSLANMLEIMIRAYAEVETGGHAQVLSVRKSTVRR